MLRFEQPYQSISEAQEAISNGKTTVKALVEGYLKAIKELDPQLNAITALNEHAVADAEKLDVRSLEFLAPPLPSDSYKECVTSRTS